MNSDQFQACLAFSGVPLASALVQLSLQYRVPVAPGPGLMLPGDWLVLLLSCLTCVPMCPLLRLQFCFQRSWLAFNRRRELGGMEDGK